MSEDHRVNLDLEENSKYRVAFDIAKMVARSEKMPAGENFGNRFLSIYAQCLQVCNNPWNIDTVIETGRMVK